MRTLMIALVLAGAAAAQPCPNCAPAVRVTVTMPAQRPPVREVIREVPVYREAPVYRETVREVPVYRDFPVYRVYAAPVLAGPPIVGPWYLGKRADLRRMGW